MYLLYIKLQKYGKYKGFYDKFLSECRANTIKIGVTFFEAEDTIDDTSTKDIRLDYLVTPQKVYSF